MELYFIMKTILRKTVSLTRQTYMYINLIMKCQQLQMKLLNSKNSNKNSFLFTKRKVFYNVKNKRLDCFRPFENLGIGISASVSTFQTFSLCLLKFYFKT